MVDFYFISNLKEILSKYLTMFMYCPMAECGAKICYHISPNKKSVLSVKENIPLFLFSYSICPCYFNK